jgi:C_GCAxxG_C_C family probable redox protein
MTIQERAEKGAAYKAEGRYNCTRSVLAAFNDIIKIDEKELVALAAGFVGGMGNMEGTCGALVGAIMVAGIISEGNGTLKYSRIIVDKFKELCGATICKDLKGIDGTHYLCSCPDCIKNAILALGCAFDIDNEGGK